MACQAINSWTFTDLVAAFVDLSIAYCLLCASAFSYLASKFLALFGLCLPCPCDGLFWNHPRNNAHCLQRHLSDCPYEKISLVRSAVLTKSPFETLWDDGDDDRDCGRDNGELGRGASSGLLFKPPGVELGAADVEGFKEGECGVEAERVVGRRTRNGLRRRRRGGSVSNGKLSSVSSYDTLRSDARNTPQSPPSVRKNGDEVSDSADDFRGGREAPKDFDWFERDSLGLELNNQDEGSKHVGEGTVQVEVLGGKEGRDLGVEKNVKNTVRVLEQALEEEHAARSALYVELEKERSAAASAADEAMAMILRLQEEKALIEMEARQYQRMIEAKAAYDAEEMNILKEILLRREREKHFLEKEVEEYRQMVLGNYQSDSHSQDVAVTLYPGEDPISMLQQINESIEKPKLKFVKSSADYEVASVKSLNRTLAFEMELAIPESDEDDESLKHVDVDENLISINSRASISCDPREEGHMSIDEDPLSRQKEVLKWKASIKPDELSNPAEQPGTTNVCVDLASKSSDLQYQESKDPPYSVLDSESCVYDVHVIGDESKMSNSAKVPRKFGSSSFNALETLYDVRKSSSDVTSGLPPRGKSKVADFRRNSMSAFDYERVKLDNEVEWLRERLRMVQKGREKLNFSVGQKERENLQLQLLEDIAGQLREIRQLDDPGKADRRASLPPSYSKVISKKRRLRSSSLNMHRST